MPSGQPRRLNIMCGHKYSEPNLNKLLVFTVFLVTTSAAAIKSCPFGKTYSVGMNVCVSCEEICNPSRDMMDTCKQRSNCKAYWPTIATPSLAPTTPPTILPTASSTAPPTTPLITPATCGTEGESPSYTWLAWTGGLLAVFFVGLVIGYCLKSRRGGSDTHSIAESVTGSTIESQELQNLTKDDNSQTVKTNGFDSTFRNVRPSASDQGWFSGNESSQVPFQTATNKVTNV